MDRRKASVAHLQTAAGYLIAAGCLAWVLHGVNLADIGRDMARIHWGWVGLALAFDVGSYVCQGWRWSKLLEPLGGLPVLRATQAVYAGLFVNEVVPLRLGEVLRGVLVGRWMNAPLAAIASSMLVERLLDAVWLGVTIGLTAMFVPLPPHLLQAGDALGGLVLLGTALLILLVKAGGKREGWVGRLARQVRATGSSRMLGVAAAASFLLLAAQVLAFWLVMRAYGLRLSLWAGAVVLLLVHLGTAIPNAPGNMGTYRFFCVVGLGAFGVDKTRAAGFSMAAFLLLTAPLWGLGFLSLSRAGITLARVRLGTWPGAPVLPPDAASGP